MDCRLSTHESTVDAIGLDHDICLLVSHAAGGGGVLGSRGLWSRRFWLERLNELVQRSCNDEEHGGLHEEGALDQ